MQVDSGTEHTRRSKDRSEKNREIERDGSETSGAGSRRILSTLKLGSYDGTTCLETFLAKFRNISEYYSWSEHDKMCHLRASLEGRAGQVL